MAVPSDRERLARLETRAREADNALKQLKSYVQLLKTKAGVLHPTIDEEDLVTLASVHVNQFYFSCYRRPSVSSTRGTKCLIQRVANKWAVERK